MKSLFISLVSHVTLFSLFSLSLGSNLPKINYSNVSFWGKFLSSAQVSKPLSSDNRQGKHREGPFFSVFRNDLRNRAVPRFSPFLKNNPVLSGAVKPYAAFKFFEEKEIFIQEPAVFKFPAARQPAVLLHPVLPYGFSLYFKDRKSAHVELMFKIIPQGRRAPVFQIKRKITSGNLEVDLLAIRYISHYLFVQQPNFPSNSWQAVRIDLSAKND